MAIQTNKLLDLRQGTLIRRKMDIRATGPEILDENYIFNRKSSGQGKNWTNKKAGLKGPCLGHLKKEVNYFFRRLRKIPSTTRPEPMRSRLAGSGTEVEALTLKEEKVFESQKPPCELDV